MELLALGEGEIVLRSGLIVIKGDEHGHPNPCRARVTHQRAPQRLHPQSPVPHTGALPPHCDSALSSKVFGIQWISDLDLIDSGHTPLSSSLLPWGLPGSPFCSPPPSRHPTGNCLQSPFVRRGTELCLPLRWGFLRVGPDALPQTGRKKQGCVSQVILEVTKDKAKSLLPRGPVRVQSVPASRPLDSPEMPRMVPASRKAELAG